MSANGSVGPDGAASPGGAPGAAAPGGADGAGGATDQTLDWARSAELTPFEVLMWRAEADPAMRSTVVMVEVFDQEPDWERFAAAIEWSTRMVPRFRERIVAPLGGLGTPYWALDPGFDLHYHLRRVRLAEGSHAALLELAEQTAMTPLDPARPPWEAVLVGGLDGGRAALLLKLTHVLSDGMGLAQLLGGLHSRTREPTPDKPQPPAPVARPEGVVAQLGHQVRGDLGALGGAVLGVAEAVASEVVGVVARPRRAARWVPDALAYVASARRVLSAPAAEPLPLLARRTSSWRFRTLDVEFAPLRAAGKAAGSSVNDAYIAALLAGFRRWCALQGSPVAPDRTMPVSVPVSVRRPDDAAGGNRFAPGRLAGPVGIVDPVERIRAVAAGMRAARGEPALEAVDRVTPLVSRLPGSLIATFGGDMTRGNDLQASNIPGLREEVFLAGARIDRLYPFAPLPGCAAMIAMVTHGDTCCVAANLDAGAIPDPDAFTTCLREGFDEVLDTVR